MLPFKNLLAIVALCSSGSALFAEDSAAKTPSPGGAAAEKLGWHLATKAYTFRARTLYETIEATQALGLKYFELNPSQKLSAENPVNTDANLPENLRTEMKQRFAAAGIKIVNFGVVKLGKDEAADRKIFAYAKDLGVENLVSEPEPGSFDLLDRLTEEYGVNVAIHNHPVPSRYADPATVLEAIKGHSARIGACADTGHWTRSGLDAVECLKQLKGHVLTLHFKDVDEKKKDVPWGTGKTDVRGMLGELKRQSFHGTFSMEYESSAGDKLMADLAECIAFFDRTTAELAK